MFQWPVGEDCAAGVISSGRVNCARSSGPIFTPPRFFGENCPLLVFLIARVANNLSPRYSSKSPSRRRFEKPRATVEGTVFRPRTVVGRPAGGNKIKIYRRPLLRPFRDSPITICVYVESSKQHTHKHCIYIYIYGAFHVKPDGRNLWLSLTGLKVLTYKIEIYFK